MQQSTAQRIGIVASIVGAIGAIAYLLRKPQQGTAAVGGQYIGLPTITVPGLEVAAAAPAGEGGPGAPAALPANITPTPAEIYQYFNMSFQPAGAYPSTVIMSNVPPALLFPKYVTGVEGDSAIRDGAQNGSGCGCKASGCIGGACRGNPCANTPGALTYRDGAGACAATTEGRLLDSIERCKPGAVNDSVKNMIGWNQDYWPGATPDAGLFIQAAAGAYYNLPSQVPTAKFEFVNDVPPSRFGAS